MKDENHILNINKRNVILVYLLYAIDLLSFILSMINESFIFIELMTCPYLLYRTYAYFNHIENEFYIAYNMEDNNKRKDRIMNISGLLNTHNMTILIISYASTILYWIRCIKDIAIPLNIGMIKIYVIIFGLIYIVTTSFNIGKFVTCITKFEHTVQGIIGSRLKGLI